MNTVYLGLGANLNQPVAQLDAAVAALQTLDPELRVSRYYGSKPMGPQDQPDYVNAVAMLRTALSATALLAHTQQIELNLGRVRKAERWGPRTLDIDILLFNNEVIELPELVVPHYGMRVREFVLYPLAELAPELVLPCGTLLSQLLASVPRNGLHPLPDAKGHLHG